MIIIKTPDKIEDMMLAPCVMNCAVYYKHVGIRKNSIPCEGCLKGDIGKPEHCRKCKIKACTQEKGYMHCFVCGGFPCKLVKNLDKSYKKRYNVSLVEYGKTAKEQGLSIFLDENRKHWTCVECGGAFSLHDGVCSECGKGSVING